MATKRFAEYTGVITADTAATAGTAVLRDSNGDATLARRGAVTRITVSGGEYLADVDKTGAYTAAADDRIIICDASGGAFSVTLPAVSGATGQVLTIKRTSASNNVTIDGDGSETIDGATTKALATQYAAATIYCDGTAWFILNQMGTVS